MRGRKPKPTAIKRLEGNPGKRPLNIYEPKPPKKAPMCPNWLDEEAQREWHRLSKIMETMGVLTEADMAMFAIYCDAYSKWKDATDFINQHGQIFQTPSGYMQQVPQVSIAQTYGKLMSKIATEFGLTPASRSRIIAGVSGGEELDEMDELLDG